MFKMKGAPTSNIIEFATEVDSRGDFLVKANGVLLLYIDNRSGITELVWVGEGNLKKLSGQIKFEGNYVKTNR